MIPRVIVYRTADHPPLWVWNRYDRIIGAALRVGSRRLLSVQWRRP